LRSASELHCLVVQCRNGFASTNFLY